MAKQTVGSSADRWQRPSSRGSGLIPLNTSHNHHQSGSASTGIVTSSLDVPSSHHHHHSQPPNTQGQQHAHSSQQQQPQQQYSRKKGPGTSGTSCSQQQKHQQIITTGGVGGSSSGGGGLRDEVMSPPGMNSERDSRGDRSTGRTGGQQQNQGHSSDIIANTIVHQHDLEGLESCSRNPLLCLICNNVYEDPRLLSCYHSFCAKCLPGRLGDAKLVCPLCGKPTALKDGSGPPTDHLLRFLLHTSTDIHPSCANCDNKGRVPMYYCNTCGQVLCNGCREETHRAKMFSAHDIIPVSKYTKDTPKKCSVHGEQYIMFSNVQKSMLCINCYRDTAMESRLHCVDLETAYSQGCRKLDRAVMSLRDLQIAVRDGITMLKSVLEELRRNSDSEKSAVNAVCQTILDALTKTQENLLRDVDCQLEGKDKVIRGQLCQLRSVLPTIKLHLTMCATIANATNKYDFLDLAYPLIDRLTAITHMGYPYSRPGQSNQIKSTYKAEIARTLEPWVAGAQQQTTASSSSGLVGAAASTVTNASVASASSHTTKDYAHPSVNIASKDGAFGEPTYSQYFPMSRSTVTPVMGHKTHAGLVGGGYAAPAGIGAGPSSGRKTPMSGHPKTKGDASDEHFAAHCRSFSAHVNELNQRLSRLKDQVQELHRDVTLQKGSSHASRAENAIREGLFLEDQLERRYAEMERIRKHLECHWNENIRQIRMEQEVFQSQMTDLLAMKSEVKQLSSLLQQLQSFLKSLSVHPPQQQQPGGGSGGGSGGAAGGQNSVAPGQMGSGGGGGQGLPPPVQGGSGQPNRQQQFTHDNKSYHMSSAPETRRAESGSQVTPSLGEMVYADVSKGTGTSSLGPALKSDLSRLSGRSLAAQHQLPSSFTPLTSTSVGGLSGKQKFQAHQSQQGHIPRPYQGKQASQAEMEYIQVDTSYSHPQHLGKPSSSMMPGSSVVGTSGIGRPISVQGLGSNISEASMKKGVLSQLIDKVRSKDDRKKSSASGVSSSSSGGTIPQTQQPVIHTASSLAAQRALTMFSVDAQCQYGLDSSAVSALALANSNVNRSGGGGGGNTQHRHDSRPTYTRAKSFVKSKSDDERPPSKLSKQLRARSAGQLETESLLRSLSSGSKDASRILSLYQSLSKTLIERENQQMQQQQQHQHQQQQRQSYPQSYNNQYSDRKFQDSSEGRGERRGANGISSLISTMPKGSRGNVNTFPPSHNHSVQSNSLGRIHSVSKASSSSRSIPDTDKYIQRQSGGRESHTPSEDDYQQIPVAIRSHPIARSHSAPPRKVSSSSQQQQQHQSVGSKEQVKVFVHEEPRNGNNRSTNVEPRSTRSSPSATLSKSLEESYLYGYLTQQHSGGLTSSSSGQSGFLAGPSSAFSVPGKQKPVSCESLISLGTEQNNSNSHSRKSSIDFDRRSVVTVRRAGSKSALITRQHSWETGAQLSSKREQSVSTPHLSPSDDPFGSGRSSPQSGTVDGASISVIRRSRIYDDDDLVVGNTLHKADSFEGHEEAVRSIVAAVQETRTLQRRLQSN